MRQLEVYVNDVKAGLLTELNPGKGYTFVYTEAYAVSDMPPVSLTLPKRKEAYEAEFLFPFFTNLLPEGANRNYNSFTVIKVSIQWLKRGHRSRIMFRPIASAR